MDKEARLIVNAYRLDEEQAALVDKGVTAARRIGVAGIKRYLNSYDHRMTDREKAANDRVWERNYRTLISIVNELSATDSGYSMGDGGETNGEAAAREVASFYEEYLRSKGTFETLSSIFAANCYLVSYLSTYGQKLIMESGGDLQATKARMDNDPSAASPLRITSHIYELNRYLFGIEAVEVFLKLDGFTEHIAPPFRYEEAIQRANEYNELIGNATEPLRRIETPPPPKITDKDVKKAARLCRTHSISSSFAFMTFLDEAEKATGVVFGLIAG